MVKKVLLPITAFCVFAFILLSQVGKHSIDPDTGQEIILNGKLLVANKFSNSVLLINLETGRIAHEFEVGKEPHEVAVSPDEQFIVIGNYKDPSLTIIDRTSGGVVRNMPLNEHLKPHGITFLSDTNKVLVTSETQKSLLLIDVKSREIVKTINTAPHESHMVSYHRQNHWAVTTNLHSNSVSIISLKNDSLVANILVGENPEGIDISPNGKEIWVANGNDNTIAIIDTDKLQVIETIPTGGFPIRIKFTPDEQYAIVNCKGSKEINIFRTKDRRPIKSISLIRSKLEEFLSHTQVPTGLIIHPNSSLAFISTSNTDRIMIIDLKNMKVMKSLKVGNHPDGIGFVK